MIMLVMAIRDRAVDTFARPWFVSSRPQGVRYFKDEINRRSDDNPLSKHPEDYDLYFLGTFDDATGHFDSKRPEQVAIGKDLVGV